MHEALDEALRRGDVERALSLSRQWAEGLLGQERQPDQAGLEIARAVAATYRDLVTESVHQYQGRVAEALPDGVGSVIERALKRLMDITFAWEQRLELVFRERLARELRDFTRSRNYEQAVENVRLLCSAARTGDDALRLAQYCGTILGTCENHPREVETVINHLNKTPGSYALTHELVNELSEARQKRLDLVMRSRMETREVEWMRTLTETVVEIQRQLPSKERMDEPDEALLRETGDLMRALVRVPVWRNQPAKFVDATLLLAEFVPKELAVAAAQSGIEQRVYMTLGFTAKKAILLTFGELGKIDRFTDSFERFARDHAFDTPYLKFFVEVMGAIRSPAFYTFLVECFSDKRLTPLQEEIVDALGNIGNADARNLLLKHLDEVLSAKVIDPPRVRTATRVIVSLGKLSRSPRLTPGERADLIRRALRAIPPDQTRMAMQAALQFFTYNPDVLPEDLKEWATAVLTQSLWLQDDSPEWAKGSERQESILGHREPVTEALKRLVTEAPGPFLERIERQALRYSGAYMAVAEVCEKTRLEDALPTLETMLRNALAFDDSDVTRYEAETYWDASAQQRVTLSKDRVVAPLVYAIGTIGGADAYRILSDLDDQIRSGRVTMPGADTAKFLMDFLQRLEREMGGALAAKGGEHIGEGGVGPGGGPLDGRRLDELLKTLRASFVFSGGAKRRLKKISAISELGQHTPREAIESLIQQLIDKDDMVQGAARTALLEYMGRRVPAPVRGEFLQKITGALNAKDPALRQGAIQTLREVGPRRPEVRTLIEQEMKAAESATTQKQIQLLLQESGPMRAPGGDAPIETAPGEEPAATDEQPEGPAQLSRVNILELKRQYVLARQEWIRGGKQGPPPEPPPGV